MNIIFSLVLGVHLGLEGEYNDVHPHVRFTTDSVIAGAYYNSERNISTYVGRRWEYNDFGFEAGAVTGYTQSPIIPFVRGTYDNFFVAPALEGDDTVGAVIGYEFKW